jgi:hypothetical protein
MRRRVPPAQRSAVRRSATGRTARVPPAPRLAARRSATDRTAEARPVRLSAARRSAMAFLPRVRTSRRTQPTRPTRRIVSNLAPAAPRRPGPTEGPGRFVCWTQNGGRVCFSTAAAGSGGIGDPPSPFQAYAPIKRKLSSSAPDLLEAGALRFAEVHPLCRPAATPRTTRTMGGSPRI